MERDTILRVLAEAGHAEHAADVEALLQPAIFIHTDRLAEPPELAEDEEDEEDEGDEEDDEGPSLPFDEALASLPLGASRFGGIPDLPPGVAWPTRDDVPMEFVAQIRLADVAPHDAAGLLPKKGSLLFFYNSQWTTFDEDEDHACCAVIFHDGEDDALVRTPPPRVDFQGEFDDEPRLAPYVHGIAKLRFEPYPSVPGGVSPFVNGSPLQPFWQDFHAYHSSKLVPDDEPGSHSHLLGYVSQQDYVGAHANGTDDQLLLEVDSDDDAGFQWGDCQSLFFLLRKDELARRDFSKVRLYSILG